MCVTVTVTVDSKRECLSDTSELTPVNKTVCLCRLYTKNNRRRSVINISARLGCSGTEQSVGHLFV